MTCFFKLTAHLQWTNHKDRQADGRLRSVITYNGKLPGPLLVVCQDDIVIVKLINKIRDGPVTNADGSPNSTSLHFHGIRQVGVMNRTSGKPEKGYRGFGPWSDGVPFVTQCPVPGGLPHTHSHSNVFHYRFRAGRNPYSQYEGLPYDDLNAPPGTYWYHSHVGAQRTNGLQGALIIKEKYNKLYKNLIDQPRTQTIIVQEWYESPTIQAACSTLIGPG